MPSFSSYACDDTPELMPLPIFLAHRLAERLTAVRKGGELPYLRPDGKTQVTIAYDGDRAVSLDAVVVSSQHAEDVSLEGLLEPDIRQHVIAPVLAELRDAGTALRTDDYRAYINPTGKFVIGGPMGDAGLTGRKIIVDTYGGMARHGGGAFSGKDPSKVDRFRCLRHPLGRQERRRGRPGPPLRGAGRLCHRQGAARRALRRDLRHRDGAGREDPGRDPVGLRPAARRDPRRPRLPSPDLQGDRHPDAVTYQRAADASRAGDLEELATTIHENVAWHLPRTSWMARDFQGRSIRAVPYAARGSGSIP